MFRKDAKHGAANSATPYPAWFVGRIGYCSCLDAVLESAEVQDHTETLRVGARAPEFTLSAANREGQFSLSGLLTGSALILEFLRGTW